MREFERVIVPIDKSDDSLRALGPASVIAGNVGAEVVAASVVAKAGDRERVEIELRDRLAVYGIDVAGTSVQVNGFTVGQGLESVAHGPGVLVVVATHGHSRTRSLIGSVAEELVHARPRQPTILIGPSVDVDRFDLKGPIVLAVDPEQPTGQAEGLTRQVAHRLALQQMAISILPPTKRNGASTSRALPLTPAVSPSARRDALSVGADFERYVSYSTDPARSIVEFAADVGASILAVGTRQRVGLSRIAFGSVAIQAVTEAHCPVLAVPEIR